MSEKAASSKLPTTVGRNSGAVVGGEDAARVSIGHRCPSRGVNSADYTQVPDEGLGRGERQPFGVGAGGTGVQEAQPGCARLSSDSTAPRSAPFFVVVVVIIGIIVALLGKPLPAACGR